MAAKVGDAVGGQQIALAVAGVRRRDGALVGDRVDQQLDGDRQIARVARGQGHHRGEVAASVIPLVGCRPARYGCVDALGDNTLEVLRRDRVERKLRRAFAPLINSSNAVPAIKIL